MRSALPHPILGIRWCKRRPAEHHMKPIVVLFTIPFEMRLALPQPIMTIRWYKTCPAVHHMKPLVLLVTILWLLIVSTMRLKLLYKTGFAEHHIKAPIELIFRYPMY